MSKKCYTCQQTRSSDCFSKHKGRKDGLNSICKDCSRERSKQYYKDNKEKHLKTIKSNGHKYRQRNQEYVLDLLSKSKCMDCGENHILVLEFDHKHSKLANVSSMILTYSLSSLKNEIDKCDVVCSNCHSKRTHKQNNSYRYKKFTGS